MIQKKIVTAANPTLTLSLEDNCLVIKKEVGPKTMVTRFPLDGTAVEDNTPSGGTAMVGTSFYFSCCSLAPFYLFLFTGN